MTYKLLVLELNKTGAVFRTEVTGLALEGYWEAFEQDSDGDFAKACRRARAECDFMPTIKQLRSFMPDRRGRAAVEATDRYLRQLAAEKRTPWPAQIGPCDPPEPS